MKAQRSKSPVTKNSKSPPTFKGMSQPSTISSQKTASSSQKTSASSQKSRKIQEEQKAPAKSPVKKSPSTSPKLKNLKISQDEETSKSPRLKLTGSAPPKKAMSGFFLFSNEKREAVMAANPEFKMTDIAKHFGQAWAAYTDTQKEPYHQAATAEKVRYEREMKQFIEKGFFINSKGQNSTDLF